MSAKTQKPKRPQYTILKSAEREERVNFLMEKWNIKSVAHLFDHLLEVAIHKPDKFDIFDTQSTTEPGKLITELTKQMMSNKVEDENRLQSLQKELKDVKKQLSIITELLGNKDEDIEKLNKKSGKINWKNEEGF